MSEKFWVVLDLPCLSQYGLPLMGIRRSEVGRREAFIVDMKEQLLLKEQTLQLRLNGQTDDERTLEMARREIENIHATQARIRKGVYGICTDCQEEISRGQLSASPYAERCYPCQNDFDRERKMQLTQAIQHGSQNGIM